MNISRPHIVARKSILPAFLGKSFPLFIIFFVIGLVTALLGKYIFTSISFLAEIPALRIVVPAFFFFISLIPLGIFIWHVIVLKCQYTEFYDSYVIKKWGVFDKDHERCMFPKILSCHVSQTFWGRVFGYGDVHVDAIGKWDVDLHNIKRPHFVRKYLDNHFISAKEIRAMRQTVVTQ